MKMPWLKYLMLLPLWCLLFACEKQEVPQPDGEGALCVSVQLQDFARAATPGDGSVYDGGGMEDLTLVVVNPKGEVAAIQQLTALSGDAQKVKEVVFEHLNIGNHTLYAYANTERSFLTDWKIIFMTRFLINNGMTRTIRDLSLFTLVVMRAAMR